jgi:hypothetical protein
VCAVMSHRSSHVVSRRLPASGLLPLAPPLRQPVWEQRVVKGVLAGEALMR